MAVTSIWPIKGRADKVIVYITNPDKTNSFGTVLEYTKDILKTERCKYVSCLNCELEYAAEQFADTKRLWRKQGGRVCYHGYQSFEAEEVSAEQAHRIGVRLAEELWGDRFEVVVATHLNTSHFHNHFVLNAVSFIDGKKFVNSRADYRRMVEVSDRLCRDFGLSVVEPRGCGKHYAEWQSEQKNKPTVRNLIRQDIDSAVAASTTERDFWRVMRDMGYSFKIYGRSGTELKYPAVMPPDGKGYFRLHKLGEWYSLTEIRGRILQNIEKKQPFELNPHPKRKPAGINHMYSLYCQELHILVEKPGSIKRLSSLLREDIIRLDKLDEETRLLGKNGIENVTELAAYKEMLVSEIAELKQCEGDKGSLKKLRREVRLCEDIAVRSAEVEQRLDMLLEQQRSLAKEVKGDELFRGCGGTGCKDEPGRD